MTPEDQRALFLALGERTMHLIERIPPTVPEKRRYEATIHTVGLSIAEAIAAALERPGWGHMVAGMARHPQLPAADWDSLRAAVRRHAPFPCGTCVHPIDVHRYLPSGAYAACQAHACDCGRWTEANPPSPETLHIWQPGDTI